MMGQISHTVDRIAEAVEQTGDTPSRRRLLTAGVVTGLLGAAATATANDEGYELFSRADDPGKNWKRSENRLLRRITYGFNPAEQALANSLGYTKYLEYHLNPGAIDDSAVDTVLRERCPRIFMTPAQLYAIGDDWVTIQQLGEATLLRSVFSKRQLHERMVEFWTDHFNIHIDKVGGWLKAAHDRDVIRQHALGKFSDLLIGTARSPAMLDYLDNTQSYQENPNVNFARESMELHTISVSGGYTPDDIRNVARCFTGWSYRWDPEHVDHGRFRFNDWAHARSKKRVLGVDITPGGVEEGEQVLQILLRHPKTAWFISLKMTRWLLGYKPSDSLVKSVAKVFTKTGGDIKAMIRAILSKSNVSKAAPKYKRPYHLMVSALRATEANLDGQLWTLRYDYIDAAGQLPFSWSPPDGFPDRVDFWAGLILPRWNFGLSLIRNRVWGVKTDVVALVSGLTTAETITQRINERLFGNEMTTADKNALIAFLKAKPITTTRIREAFALAITSPSFQWY